MRKDIPVEDFINGIPKAELHVHIEGTFEPELMFKIAKRNNARIKYRSVEEIRRLTASITFRISSTFIMKGPAS